MFAPTRTPPDPWRAAQRTAPHAARLCQLVCSIKNRKDPLTSLHARVYCSRQLQRCVPRPECIKRGDRRAAPAIRAASFAARTKLLAAWQKQGDGGDVFDKNVRVLFRAFHLQLVSLSTIIASEIRVSIKNPENVLQAAKALRGSFGLAPTAEPPAPVNPTGARWNARTSLIGAPLW